MSIASELIKVVAGAQKSEARSNQKQVGPSEVGGCSRKLWLRLNDAPKTNPDTLRFASIMGTAIHSYIQSAFYANDPFEDKYLLEKEWVSEKHGLMGHVDLYDIDNKEVVDWKTTTKKNLSGYFPSKQQRWQVQLYGLLLVENGYDVDKVTLVGIPRDGSEKDIVYHSEPYDPAVAEEALAWLREVTSMTEPPAPSKDASFCRNYCGFYDATGQVGCAGIPKEQAEDTTIDDPRLSTAASYYLEISDQIKELEKEKDVIKEMLIGVSGVTDEGVKVAWSNVKGRKTIDSDAVVAFYVRHNEEIPYKFGEPTDRLAISKVARG